jgi:predicted Zn-dependent protease
VSGAALSVLFSLLLGGQAAPQARPAPPSSFTSLAEQADAARDANRLDDAANLYRKALAQRPGWTEGWWSLGTILYDQDSYGPAARAFRHLLAYDPKNGTAHLMLALCEYQANRNDSALEHIETAKKLGIKSDRQLVRVLEYHEGLLLLRKGRYEDAIDALKSLVDDGINSDELSFALGLGVLLVRPDAAPSADAPDHQVILRVGRAERSRLAQQWDAAKTEYRALAQEFPSFPNMHYAFGRFLLALDAPDAAIEQFQAEIANNARHVRARMQIAASYYRVDSAKGLPYAQDVVRIEPRYPFGHYLLGLLYLDTHDLSHAIPALETAARMVPTEPQFQYSLGSAYAQAGRRADAARARAAFTRLGGTHPPGSGEAPERPRLQLDQPQ